jgi:hypothetical protein
METCKLCNAQFKSKKSIQFHLSRTHSFTHNNSKEYYDTWYKTDDEGLDPFTKGQTEFISIGRGYKRFDGSEESNKKKLATSTVEYWVNVKGYTLEEAQSYFNSMKKEAGLKSKATWNRNVSENPDHVYSGGYSVKKFMLDGFSEEDAIKRHEDARLRRKDSLKETYKKNPDMFVGKRMGQVEYWVNGGYSYEDAKKKVKESQTTFTLDKCIQRYGEIEGPLRYHARHTSWSKKMEEKYKNGEFSRHSPTKPQSIRSSKVELEFIESLVNTAELPIGSYDAMINDSVQFSFFSRELGKTLLYDFKYGKKIIEFNGDYWHCNPLKYKPAQFNYALGCTSEERWEYDMIKMSAAESLGYDVMTVWESEWRTSPKQTLDKCIQFLNSK